MPDSVPCTHIHYFLIRPSYYPVSPISVRGQDRKQNLLEETYGESDLIQGIGRLRNLRAFGRMNSGSSGMLLAFCRKLLPLLEATVVKVLSFRYFSGVASTLIKLESGNRHICILTRRNAPAPASGHCSLSCCRLLKCV